MRWFLRFAGACGAALLLACGGGRRGGGPGRDGGADAPPPPPADGGRLPDVSVPPDAGGDPGPSRLRVVSWNVRNLFDTVDDPRTFDDVPAPAELEGKLAALGAVLRVLDADVVLLQEVENRRVLDALADGPLAGLGYEERVLLDGRDPRGIDVAALSRLPLLRVASHLDERFPGPDGSGTFRFARDLLELSVRVGGGTLVVATTHFRSRRDGAEADAHRLAEATQARRIVERRASLGEGWYLLAGDLNDESGTPTLAALTQGAALRWLLEALPEAERWSYRSGRRRSLIDHALGSPALLEAARGVQARFERDEMVWQASDHAPLVVDVAF